MDFGRLIADFSASNDVTPVPPFPTCKVPVTPGRGEAARTFAADVEFNLTSIDGLAVKPVPPLGIGNVPVTPGRGDC